MIHGDFRGDYPNYFTSLKATQIKSEFSCFFEELGKESIDPAQEIEAIIRIEKGKSIATALLDINAELPLSNKQSALDLTWFLMACGYQENKGVFHRGAVRLSNLSIEQSKRFKEFYGNCKESSAHNRPSSHFREMTVGHQKGVDFGKGTLPFDKELGTLLCGRLKDGSFFIKLEREPLSLLNIAGTVKHLYHWAAHAASGGGKQEVGGKITRRETDAVEQTQKHFKKVILAWQEMTSDGKVMKLERHTRIFEMYHIVTKIANQLNENPFKIIKEEDVVIEESNIEVKRLREKFKAKCKGLEVSIESFHESISNIEYPDQACGREVLFDLNSYITS